MVRRGRLVVLMRQLADGDLAKVFALHDEFRSELAAAVRRAARGLRVELDAQAIDDLTVDTAFAILDVARSWNPDGGALPWVWAERRILTLVSAFIGQHSDPIDDDDVLSSPSEAAGSVDQRDDEEVLRALAVVIPQCRDFIDALEQVASPRNRSLVLAYRVQKAMGDPSPAATVGAQFDLSPAAVRQVVCRVRRSLRDLADREPRFTGLTDIGWLR